MWDRKNSEGASKTKNAVEVANKLTEYIITATEAEGTEASSMYDELFVKLFDYIKLFDSKSLKNLNKNL